MNMTRLSLDDIVQKLRDETPFALARYGDGEWLCALGDEGATCDGQPYTPALSDELRDSLANENMMHLVTPVSWRAGRARIKELVNDLGLEGRQWYTGSPMLDASINCELRPLIDALRERSAKAIPLIYVGPNHLRPIASLLGVHAFIATPPHNAYEAIDRLEWELASWALSLSYQPLVVALVSAGPTANVLIHRMTQHGLHNWSFIDVGSLFDPYVGVVHRSYAKGLDMELLWHANFGMLPDEVERFMYRWQVTQ